MRSRPAHVAATVAWAICAVAVLAASAAHAAAAPTACDGESVQAARRTIANAPPDVAATAAVTLPDHLPVAACGQQQRITYEIDVSECAASAGAAIWLFRVGAPYRVTADGAPLTLLNSRAMLRAELVIGGLFPTQPDVYNGRIPALFALVPGTRRVSVELQTLPYIPAGVVAARLGAVNQLLPIQAGALEAVVAYADTASGVVLVLGVLALLLWLQRRPDQGLLWLAIACGLWGLRGLAYFSHAVYLAPLAFEQFNSINVLLTSAALAMSTGHALRSLQQRHATILGIVVATCVIAFLLSGAMQVGAAAVRALALAASFGMVGWLVAVVWRQRRSMARWECATLVGVLLSLLACAIHDLMVVGGWLAPSSSSYVFWGFILVLIGFAATSAQYVVLTLNRAERANEELERHVASKTHELEHSYALLRESEQESARAQERGRLLRDMHDGLGAHLMTTLRAVERGALTAQELTRSLQDGLDELRLLMDSTDMGHYLPTALAAWRDRWDARLLGAGVALEWSIDESLEHVQLTPDCALQVMRILQEAAANIVKHSQATRMKVDARVTITELGATLRIEVIDNGVGIGAGPASAASRGLKNMRYRAEQVSAQVAIERLDLPAQGTRVLLCVPVLANQETNPRLAASIVASARDEMPSLR